MITTTAVKNIQLQALADHIDAGNSAGSMTLYSGSAPAAVGAISDQVALVTLALSYPCATLIESGVMTLGAIAEQMVIETGRAGFARICDSTGSAVCDMSVGISGSSADLVFPTVDFIAGAYVRITGATINGA